MKKTLAIVAAIALSLTLMTLPAANADSSQGGQPALILNPGGGILAEGADGIRIHFNGRFRPFTGSDQVYFDGDEQWCCGGAGPVLAVGNVAFGEAGAANLGMASWDSVSITGQRGAFEEIAAGVNDNPTSTATGDAGARITYEKTTVSGFVYRVLREISYVYPKNFYDEDWTVVIPSGNTDVVKLYLGGDAAPGGSDAGDGSSALRGAGLRVVYEANPYSGQYISYAPRSLASNFTHYFVGQYNAPYGTIFSGGNLDDSVNTSTHDAGLQIQWTFGATAGSFTRSMRTTVGYNEDIGSEPEPDSPPGDPAPRSAPTSTPEKQHVMTLNKSPRAGAKVAMFGSYFGRITEAYVGGVKVEILSTSESRIDIRIPKGLVGPLDVELISPLGKLVLPKHLNVRRAAGTESSRDSIQIGGFEPNSRKLSAQMRSQIDRWLARYPDRTNLTCTGFTSLPRRTSDVELSTNRGVTACEYAKSQRPELVTQVAQGIEDPRPGSSVRRVQLALKP